MWVITVNSDTLGELGEPRGWGNPRIWTERLGNGVARETERPAPRSSGDSDSSAAYLIQGSTQKSLKTLLVVSVGTWVHFAHDFVCDAYAPARHEADVMALEWSSRTEITQVFPVRAFL